MSILDKNINNSGKKAKWIKSEIPCVDYVCSLCGASCWKYDDNGVINQSNFCPTCGAKMTPNHLFADINEAITYCNEAYNHQTMALGQYKQISEWLQQFKILHDRFTAQDVLDRECVHGERGKRGKCPYCKTPVSRAEDRFHCGTCGQKLLWF